MKAILLTFIVLVHFLVYATVDAIRDLRRVR
jgi:hypothetical protein